MFKRQEEHDESAQNEGIAHNVKVLKSVKECSGVTIAFLRFEEQNQADDGYTSKRQVDIKTPSPRLCIRLEYLLCSSVRKSYHKVRKHTT